MKSKSQIVDEIHQRGLAAVARFKSCEIELIEVLEQADRFRVHTAMGFSSLFVYATSGLGLSDEVAYIYINVARKAREVPALKEAIRAGAVSVSKAKRITPVLKPENQQHWIDLAARCSKRELEKLVATENPRAEIVEKANYVSRDRVQLQVGVSENFMIELRRAQDVLSQKRHRPVSLEETLSLSVGLLLEREDPLARAKRQVAKGKAEPSQLGPGTVAMAGAGDPAAKRKPIPAATRHKLLVKFNGQCGFVHRDGNRCGQRRFLDVHHIKPLCEGGTDELSNLELLCSGHHRTRHH